MLPHGLEGITQNVVRSDYIRPMPEDGHGDDLQAAGVPEPVLSPVAEAVPQRTKKVATVISP